MKEDGGVDFTCTRLQFMLLGVARVLKKEQGLRK